MNLLVLNTSIWVFYLLELNFRQTDLNCLFSICINFGTQLSATSYMSIYNEEALLRVYSLIILLSKITVRSVVSKRDISVSYFLRNTLISKLYFQN